MKTVAEKEKAIQEKAYQIWESEGKPEGKDREHWDRAQFIIETIEILEDMREENETNEEPRRGLLPFMVYESVVSPQYGRIDRR